MISTPLEHAAGNVCSKNHLLSKSRLSSPARSSYILAGLLNLLKKVIRNGDLNDADTSTRNRAIRESQSGMTGEYLVALYASLYPRETHESIRCSSFDILSTCFKKTR